MKQLIIITALIFVSSLTFAQKTVSDYVKTNEGTVFYQEVNHGLFNFLNGKINGEKTSYKKDDVIEYKKDGQIYKKLPEIIDNETTGDYVFMKAIDYRCGLILYEQKSIDNNGNIYKSYYVFDNDKFVVDVNKNNYETLISFFTGEIFYNSAVAF